MIAISNTQDVINGAIVLAIHIIAPAAAFVLTAGLVVAIGTALTSTERP